MPAASSASNVFFSSDDQPSGSNIQLLHKRSVISPLSDPPSSQRRGVAWSDEPHKVKLFYKADSILPSPSPTKTSAPPPSIRSYLHEQDQNTPSSPTITPSPTRKQPKLSSSPPPIPKSILKPLVSEIRLATSVPEARWLNKEAARLLVCGKRPRLVARDSFQVAIMRQAAAEGSGKGKGKERAFEATDGETVDVGKDDSEEEEEEVEEGGALMTDSLVEIILSGAEDLLTLEEAYTTLTQRLRLKFAPDSSSPSVDDAIRIAVQPIRDEASAMVRAFMRDLGRLLGKVPNSEQMDDSPFRPIPPRRASSPAQRRLHSSPVPETTVDPRPGYSEAQVRYRREASGVGRAAIRLLMLIFHFPSLYDSFSQADLTTLLDQVMAIPRTPVMPTPNAKNLTYSSTITLLAQMRIPAAAVSPVKDKIVQAVVFAMSGTLGAAAAGKEEVKARARKEGLLAVRQLITTYPDLFLPHHADLLPPALACVRISSRESRMDAAATLATFAASKASLLSSSSADVTQQAREEWQNKRNVAHKLEQTVVAYLKSIVRQDGQRTTEAARLRQLLGDSMGKSGTPDEEVLWASATWSSIVTLMGGSYVSSGLTPIMDFLVDRAIKEPNNSNRVLFSAVAWTHAIHAYLSVGMTAAIADDGSVTRSYKPFHDSTDRLSLIQFPVDLAIEWANGPNRAVKVLQTVGESERYTWRREEKSRRKSWMVTCGSFAPAVLYAYSGMAIHHHDQPPKETAQWSGLPSSDGAPIPEASIEAMKMERLDQTWEKVVKPILTGLLAVKGVDTLKTCGWHAIAAITSSAPPSTVWSLDRILSTPFLDGQAFGMAGPVVMDDFAADLEDDAVKAGEIPAWGSAWVLAHLSELLDLLQEALMGVQGVEGKINYVRTLSGDPVLPAALLRIWCNLLKAVASTRESDYPTFLERTQMIVQRIVSLWNLDPSDYLAVGAFGPDGCAQDLDETRLTLFTKLVESSAELLGRTVFVQTTFAWPTTTSGELPVFGTIDGRSSPSSLLLTTLLRSSPLSSRLSQCADTAFCAILDTLLDLTGSAPDYGNLLGDATNSLSWLFKDDRVTQASVWRALAIRWCRRLEVQAPAAIMDGEMKSNHTGSLLVSLLLAPYKGKDIKSAWHDRPETINLDAWKSLLDVTVRRFRAKGVESNEGVLDEVARQLFACYSEYKVTSTSTMSISCLMGMISQMTSAITEEGSKHIPVELLRLISSSLVESYPTTENSSGDVQTLISPAIGDLFDTIASAYSSDPSWSAPKILAPEFHIGLCIWLNDESRQCGQVLNESIDKLYCAILSLLSRSVSAGDIPATGQTLDTYIDLIAPRLSLAGSAAVMTSFKEFWQSGFENVDLELSDDVRDFLSQIVSAVPGLIAVKGLEEVEPFGSEHNQRLFPHSQVLVEDTEAVIQLEPTPDPSEGPIEAEISVALPASTIEYEADVSSSVINPDEVTVAAIEPALVDSNPSTSPSDSQADTSSVEEHIQSNDVFGPSSMVENRKRNRAGKGRALGVTQSYPEASGSKRVKLDSGKQDRTVIPDSQEEAEEAGEDIQVMEQRAESAPPAPSIFNRILGKASSFGFFSPSRRRKPEADFEIVISASASPPRKSKKRSREDSGRTSSSSSSTSSKKSRSSRESGRSKRKESSSSSQSSSRSGGSDSADAITVSSGDEKNDDVDDEDEEEVKQEDSPRTKARIRAEGLAHGGILSKPKLAPTPSYRSSSKVRSKKKSKELPIPITQGRFDDANESILDQPAEPAPTSSSPNASPGRTSQQERILRMMEQAASAMAAVEGMDVESTVEMMHYADVIKGAGVKNLQRSAMRTRGSKK